MSWSRGIDLCCRDARLLSLKTTMNEQTLEWLAIAPTGGLDSHAHGIERPSSRSAGFTDVTAVLTAEGQFRGETVNVSFRSEARPIARIAVSDDGTRCQLAVVQETSAVSTPWVPGVEANRDVKAELHPGSLYDVVPFRSSNNARGDLPVGDQMIHLAEDQYIWLKKAL